MKEYIRLEYRDCFSDTPREKSEYLQGISRDILLKFCCLLLTREQETVYDYLCGPHNYFTEENKEFTSRLWRQLSQRHKGNIDSYIVTNIESSLRLYEFVFDNIYTTETTLSSAKIEINVFRAYLLFNTQVNQSDIVASQSTEDILENRAKALLLAQMFQYFDISNFNFMQELYVQIVKAVYLYKFLSNNTKVLYEAYLAHYDCPDWQEFMSAIIAFAFIYWGREDKDTYVNLLVDPQEEAYKWKCDFIEKLVLDGEIEDIDFRVLRSHPIYKVAEGKYCIVYGYFLLELIYKGVYFKLAKLNDSLPKKEQIKSFRSFYCDHFSERTLLYNVLQDIYGKKYIQMPGEYIKTKYSIYAEPDYYIRNGNKIFLFESKDILIPSQAKISNDYKVISAELKKRLYYEEKGTKKDKKAVLQLLHNIKKLLNKTAEWDNTYKKKNISIYPIIILHDNIYNCPGINHLVNLWFRQELENMKDEYDISGIENVTIINIDVFIAYRDFLRKPEGALDKLISSYHKFLSQNIYKTARCEQELLDKYKQRLISFEYYLSGKYAPDYRKLLTRVTESYLRE